MEIIFNEIYYQELKKLSLKINDKIVALSGDATKEMLTKIMTGFLKMDDGIMTVGNLSITNNTSLNEIKKLQNLVGYVFSDPSKYLKNLTVQQEINLNLKIMHQKNKKLKIMKALNLVELDEKKLKQKSLSTTMLEQYLIIIASFLAINSKIIILNQIDSFLTIGEQKKLKRILQKLKKSDINIIIVSNNSNFYFDIIEKVYYFDNYKLKFICDNKCFFEQSIDKVMNKSLIPNFIVLANKEGHNLQKEKEINELIKEIYRNVTSKHE